PDARDVWVFDRKGKSFARLTAWQGNDGKPKWLNDREFVYLSDREKGTLNLYRTWVGQDQQNARALTHFDDIDIDDFDVSADGRTLVFSRWDKLYRIDLASDAAQPEAIEIRAGEDESDRFQMKDIARSVTESALSPDGKTMAFVAFGDVYVRGTEPKSLTRRVTTWPAREKEIAWSPDGEKIYFVSDENGNEAIYSASVKLTRQELKKKFSGPTTQPATQGSGEGEPAEHRSGGADDSAEQFRRRSDPGGPATAPSGSSSKDSATEPSKWSDALSFDIEKVSSSEVGDTMPSPSPDGKSLAFKRGKGDLWIMNSADKTASRLLKAWSEQLEWRWSPDSRFIAYATEDQNNNSDVWIVPADGSSQPVNISRHPNNEFSPRWSADGKILALLSERVNDEHDVWVVYLDKNLEAMTPQELDAYYKEANAAAKKRAPLPTTKPTTKPSTTPSAARREKGAGKLDLDDAYLRLRRVTSLPGNEANLEMSPAGDKFIFTATVAGTRGLYNIDRDATEPKKIGPMVNVQHLSLTGDQVVIVEAPPERGSSGGRGGVVKLPGGELEYYDIADRIRVDLAAQSSQKFREASRLLGAQYWDPKLNGLNWDALSLRYLALARTARTSDEFDFVANKFVGELNGSHLGINSPDPANPQARTCG
ncbi:MAG: S41 family peptidase, partial [Tepidisphaeraceae bacterium]